MPTGVMFSRIQESDDLEKIKEKHGEETVEEVCDEYEELIIDLMAATTGRIGKNIKESLDEVRDQLTDEIEEVEDYFEEMSEEE